MRIFHVTYCYIEANISVELLNKVGNITTDLEECEGQSLISAMPNCGNHKIADRFYYH